MKIICAENQSARVPAKKHPQICASGALARPTDPRTFGSGQPAARSRSSGRAPTCAGGESRLNAGPPRGSCLPPSICGYFRPWPDHVPGAGRPSRAREAHPAMGADLTRPDKGRTAGAKASVVLVVDGEPAVRKFIGGILTRAGSKCLEAAEGESGLRLAATHPISIAVVALQLPGMDGLELAWRLHSERPALCILGLSDYAELWDADGLRDLGIRRVLSAPFGPDELLRAICPSSTLSAVRPPGFARRLLAPRRASARRGVHPGAQVGDGRARTVFPVGAAVLPTTRGMPHPVLPARHGDAVRPGGASPEGIRAPRF